MTLFRLTVDLPFVIPLPDGEYECALGGQVFTVGLELIAETTGDDEKDSSVVFSVASGKVGPVGEAIEVPGVGLRRTRAFVGIKIHHQVRPLSEEKRDKLKEDCRRSLNLFLDTYRVKFRDDRVYSLTPAEFYLPRFSYAPRWAEKLHDGRVNQGITFGRYALPMRFLPTATGEALRSFIRYIAKGHSVSIVEVLLMDAHTDLSRGDFRKAVINSGTALDIAVERTARKLIANRGGLTSAAIKRLERQTMKPIVEEVLADHFGSSFLASKEWCHYEPKLRFLRNRVVHDAANPSEQQARDSVAHVESLIRSIQNRTRLLEQRENEQ